MFKNLLLIAQLLCFFIMYAQPHDDCINFDGQIDYYEIPDNGSTDFINELTFEAWIRPCDSSGHKMILSKQWCLGDENAYYFSVIDGRLKFHWDETGYCNNVQNYAWTALPVVYNNVWQHVAVTYSSQNGAQFYYNGQAVSTLLMEGSYFPITNSNQPVRVGVYKGINSVLGYFWEGGLDELRMWDQVRTASEIQSDYNILLQGSEQGLIVYHEMENINNGVVSNFANAYGNANNGVWMSSNTNYNVLASSLFCNGSVGPIVVNSVSSIPESGCGTNDGSLTVNANGDLYELYTSSGLLLSSNSTGSFSGLSSGMYYVVVHLNGFSQQTGNIVIDNLAGTLPISLVTSEPLCYLGANGSVSINVSGTGVQPGATYTISNSFGDIMNQNNSNAAEFLTAGWYYCYVDNVSGCDGFDSVYLDQPDSLYFDVVTQDPSCYNSNDGSAWIGNVFNNQGSFSVSWSGGSPSGDTVSNLSNGMYTAILVDSIGCTATSSFQILNSDTILIGQLFASPSHCRGDGAYPGSGTVSATASGGSGSLDYLWTDGNDSSIVNTWGNREPGWHFLTVTDANGCIAYDSIYLDSINPIANFNLNTNFGYTPLTVTISDSSVYRTTNTWIYNDSLFHSELIGFSDFQSPFDSIYTEVGYHDICLVVSNDFECFDTICQNIQVVAPVTLILPNVVTPNGDGWNDQWAPFQNIGLASINCKIYNRWGNLVYEISDVNQAFTGIDQNGKVLSDGIYQIVYQGIGEDKITYGGAGFVHLIK